MHAGLDLVTLHVGLCLLSDLNLIILLNESATRAPCTLEVSFRHLERTCEGFGSL